MTAPPTRAAYIPRDYQLHASDPATGDAVYLEPRTATVLCFRGKRSKPDLRRRCADLETAAQTGDEFLAALARKRQERRRRRSEARRTTSEGFAEGDLLVTDTTPPAFWQVTALIGAKTLQLRAISAVTAPASPTETRSIPQPDKFTGPPLYRRVLPGPIVRIFRAGPTARRLDPGEAPKDLSVIWTR